MSLGIDLAERSKRLFDYTVLFGVREALVMLYHCESLFFFLANYLASGSFLYFLTERDDLDRVFACGFFFRRSYLFPRFPGDSISRANVFLLTSLFFRFLYPEWYKLITVLVMDPSCSS